jgi:hypothetical protein
MGCNRWDLDWVAIVGVQGRGRSLVMCDRWGSEPMRDRWGSGLGAIVGVRNRCAIDGVQVWVRSAIL